MLKITKSHAGFSLIEMAMVVAIMGVMMGGVLSIAASKQEKSATTTTVTKLDDIEESVEKFFNRYGYLPCPASPTAAEGSSTFGVATDCSSTVTSPSNTWEAGSSSDTVRGGVLPTRTLGLPDSAMYDEWGNRLGYAVIKELAVSRTNYTNFSTSATTGVIQVVDYNGNQILDPGTSNIVPYIIYSYGKDKKGAYGRKIRTDNAPDVACDATTKDGENCDQDVVFRDSEVKDSAAAASFYYDKVKWQAKTVFEDGMHGVLAVTQVSVGYRNTCAIDSSGALHCWGDNSRGQLGNGSTTSSTQPVKVIGKWQMVKTGVTTCALDMSEMLWCWGSNVFGQVGDGTTSHRSTPVQVSSTLSWKTFSGPDVSGTVCGIKSDDSLWCWGDNGYGQLGDGSTVRKKVPTAVSGGGSWKFVTVWGESTCGIKNDDSLWCWGRNDYGQLGDGTSTSKSVPTAISGGGLWQDVTLVFRNACGIKIDKSLWCWGYNKHGAVGDGMSVTRQTTPVEVVGGGLWDELAITTTDCSTMYFVSIYNRDALADSDGWSYGCGASWGWSVYPEVCGKKVDGTLWCWGYMAGVDVFTPTEISGGGVWSDVIASNGSLCAVKLSDDMLRCWGNNNVGQLGNQTTVDQALPVSVQSGNVLQSSRMGVVGVVCGISGNDNSLWCWGVNASGQVGDGTTTNRSVPTMVELR